MSVHTSLKLKNTLTRSRNVFKRVERLEILLKEDRRTQEDSVYGLPKVRTRFKIVARKKGPPTKEEGAEKTA
ncbi:MAG: small basic protein [Planctomycetota bacterium]